MIWVIVGVAIVAAGIVLFLLSRRRATDGVTSFQRQIDALSSEARRPVVDRVQELEGLGGAQDKGLGGAQDKGHEDRADDDEGTQ